MKTIPTLEWIKDQCTMVDHPLGPCWVWPRLTEKGYGCLYVSGSRQYVHRLTMALAKGAIRKGMHTDHLCRNKPCCNPEHLEEVTPKENNRRGFWVHSGLKKIDFCKRGHAFLGENIYLDPRGFKRCEVCRKERALLPEKIASARETNRRFEMKNRDKRLATAKTVYAANPELFRARCRADHEKHKEQRQAKCRAYYLANKERIALRKTQRRAEKRAAMEQAAHQG